MRHVRLFIGEKFQVEGQYYGNLLLWDFERHGPSPEEQRGSRNKSDVVSCFDSHFLGVQAMPAISERKRLKSLDHAYRPEFFDMEKWGRVNEYGEPCQEGEAGDLERDFDAGIVSIRIESVERNKFQVKLMTSDCDLFWNPVDSESEAMEQAWEVFKDIAIELALGIVD
jgi:hypothetical protein